MDNNPPAADVTVANNSFSPRNFTATVGSTVTWVWNSGGTQHNVTFDDQASPTQGSGTYARNFTAAGTYAYHCTIHGPTVMFGTVIVNASQSGGGGGGTGGGGAGGGGGGYPYGDVARTSASASQ
jgi:uncharacterized membrane protein YgcG